MLKSLARGSAIMAMVITLAGCGAVWKVIDVVVPPDPIPAPTPEPIPEPDPTPEPPVPVPTPDPGEPSMGWLFGSPQARVYWFRDQKTADATPALCAPKRCEAIADLYPDWFRGRYCCPVAPDDHALRGPLEAELMGGPLPEWELVVDSGNLERANGSDEWFFTVKGHGKGRLRWRFPNGRATSKWLEIDR